MNNTIKYADANRVDIKVIFSERKLEITVKDDGKGFNAENTRRFGNGLLNMKKRMEDIGGEFVLNSKIGSGTETRLSLYIGR